MKRATRKPTVRTQKFVVDVCYGGCWALFPDDTVRQFADEAECTKAIQHYARKQTKAREILVSRIEWRARGETTLIEPRGGFTAALRGE